MTPAVAIAPGSLAAHPRADRPWPRTSRVHPWCVAVLLVVVFLVPADSTTLPISLPVDARPDRVLLVVVFALGLLATLVRPAGMRRVGHRYGAIDVAVFAFFAVAVVSVALNVATLSSLNELAPTLKRFALLASYIAFYLFVVNAVRVDELPAFIRLVVVIATVAAAGTILQYLTAFNLFYWLTGVLSPPGTRVAPYEAILAPGGRPDITGPARHGLAVSTLLAMVLPLAVVGAVAASSARERLLYRVAAFVVLVGCVATLRRSGVVLPFIATSVVIVLGGRRMLPMAASFLVLLIAAPVVAPGAVGQVRSQFSSSNVAAQNSVAGRTADYGAIVPDIDARALFGRGYGTYSAERYRYLDNQYLGALIGIGFVGTAVYLALMLTGAASAARTARRGRAAQSWIGLACVGSILAYVMANVLFDTLAFPQAPYGFFLILAIVSILRRPDAEPA